MPPHFIPSDVGPIAGSANTIVDPITANVERAVANKQIQKSSAPWGNAIPVSAGTRTVTGKIIWSSDIRQVLVPGSADALFEVDLAVSFGFAGAAPADRPASQLIHVWANQKLCFDIDDFTIATSFNNMQVTFHQGLIDATPDATILAVEGSLTPSFRNQIYAVIKKFPLWKLGLRDALPEQWLAEIFDSTIQASSITPYTMSTATFIAGSPLFIDFQRGGRYAFYTSGGAPGLVYTLDPIAEPDLIEGSRTIIPGLGSLYTILQPDRLAVADHDTGNVLVVDQTANSTPLHLVNLASARIIASIGKDSVNLLTDVGPINDPANCEITLKTSGDLVQTRFVGAPFKAYILGGIFDSLCAITVSNHTGELKLSSATNTGGSTGLLGSQNINDVVAYPIIGRPDLNMNTTPSNNSGGWLAGTNGIPVAVQNQDGFVFVTRGNLVTMYRLSTSFDNNNPTPPEFPGDLPHANGIIQFSEHLDVIDIPGGDVRALYIDRSDWNLVLFWQTRNVATEMNISKYKITTVQVPEQGWRPYVESQPLWSKKLEKFFHVDTAMDTIKESVLNGVFGYFDGNVGDFVEIDLSNGDVLHDTPLVRFGGTGYTYNPRLGTVEYVNTGINKIEHIKLRSTLAQKILLSDVIRAFMISAGYAEDEFDIDAAITDKVWGGMMDQTSDLWATLKNMGTVYGFNFFVSGDKVVFRKAADTDSPLTYSIDIGNLWPAQDDLHEALTTTFAAPAELSGNVAVTYIDRDQHYVANTQSYHRSSFPRKIAANNNDTTVPIPIVMHAAEALRRSAIATFAGYSQSQVQSFKLPLLYLKIEPGDVLNVFTSTYSYDIQISELVLDTDWTLSVTGTNKDVRPSTAFRLDADGEWVAPGSAPFTADPSTPKSAPSSVSESHGVAFDIPLLRVADNITNIYATLYVGALGKTTAWVGASIETHVNNDPWAQFFHSSISVPVGTASAALPATSEPWTTDNTTVLTVTATNFDTARLASVTDEQMRAGYNAMLVGHDGAWELIYFGQVTALNSAQVQISKLLRGRRGTEGNCNSHVVSDQIFFLYLNNARQGLLPFGTDVADIDGLLHSRARGDSFSGNVSETVTLIEGNSVKPWAPVRPKAILGSSINAVGSPSYSNLLGGGGFGTESHVDRRVYCTVTGTNISPSVGENDPNSLMDGTETNVVHWQTGGTLSQLLFDFRPSGFKQRITEFQLVVSFTPDVGSWTTEGSLDGLSWITLEASTPLLTSSVATHTFTNPDGYWFYRLRQTSGTVNGGPHLREIYFKTMADIQPNDLYITWLRRDRLANDSFVTDDVVQSEATEEYDIEILSGGVVKRTVSVIVTGAGIPFYVYLATDQATDGFTPPLATLSANVYQKSTQAGRGFPLNATIAVGVT